MDDPNRLSIGRLEAIAETSIVPCSAYDDFGRSILVLLLGQGALDFGMNDEVNDRGIMPNFDHLRRTRRTSGSSPLK